MYKFYEITFDDEWGICIKATAEPTAKQVLNHLTEEECGDYTVDNINSIDEIPENLVSAFYDVSNIDNWKVLIVD